MCEMHGEVKKRGESCTNTVIIEEYFEFRPKEVTILSFIFSIFQQIYMTNWLLWKREDSIYANMAMVYAKL